MLAYLLNEKNLLATRRGGSPGALIKRLQVFYTTNPRLRLAVPSKRIKWTKKSSLSNTGKATLVSAVKLWYGALCLKSQTLKREAGIFILSVSYFHNV
ncbi:hypothetical protein CLV24_12227 [Pontibacter ummariensis]|uniref:Uncharacterized protein n=1 Tax=Pontibacter ummariensis TaxID=1610492 RepID=A0A239JIU0_9BACT|nr:hypothetical protein CLV24_12227 [Pontibacter ummariensis]SNT05750.1 hypothetical protein SAMN06296052_12227 [Pontibacter ummariensis]